MLTRRRFLITTVSLLGAWRGLDAITLPIDEFDRSAPALSTLPSASSASSSIVPASPSPALRTLCVIDDRCQTQDLIANARLADIVHLDGDAGLLWHRVLRPFIDDAARAPNDCIAAIEGWTSHADWFVLSTLAAAHDAMARCAIRDRCDSASSRSPQSPTFAAIDAVFWRMDLTPASRGTDAAAPFDSRLTP